MDAMWSVTKYMTKLAERHSVWTSYRASYPALRIYDEIWLFVMDAVWSMMKSKNVMRISSWIKGFLVVRLDLFWCSLILDALGFTSWRLKFLGFTRSTLASHICSTDSISWVHYSREEWSLDYDRRLVRLQVYLNFNTNIHRQQSIMQFLRWFNGAQCKILHCLSRNRKSCKDHLNFGILIALDRCLMTINL
jgi:hypothetical protein